MNNSVNEIVIPKDTSNIPLITCYECPTSNAIVKDLCQKVLELSENEKNRNRYGEVAIAYNIITSSHSTIHGTMHHIELNELKNPNAKYFNRTIQNAAFNEVIIVHNHSNNRTFSLQDIRLFCENESILSLVAIGNTHNLYFIINENSDKCTRRRLYIDIIKLRSCLIRKNYTTTQINNEINIYINKLLNNPETLAKNYGFRYLRMYRKAVK